MPAGTKMGVLSLMPSGVLMMYVLEFHNRIKQYRDRFYYAVVMMNSKTLIIVHVS